MSKKRRWWIVIICMLAVTGCISLYGKLIEGKWEVDTYYKNGEEQTEEFYLLFSDYEITFHSDGEFTETYRLLNAIPITNAGAWEILNNESILQLRLMDDSSTRIFDIIELTREELRLKRNLGEGENEEFIMERPPEEIEVSGAL